MSECLSMSDGGRTKLIVALEGALVVSSKARSSDQRLILAVYGVVVSCRIDIEEFSLIAWDDLPETDTKFQVMVRACRGGKTPAAALIRRHEIERKYSRPWEVQVETPMVPFEPALDIFRCVTAVAGAGFWQMSQAARKCLPKYRCNCVSNSINLNLKGLS